MKYEVWAIDMDGPGLLTVFTESPVGQLFRECLHTNSFHQVKLPRPVEVEDWLEMARRPIKEEFTLSQNISDNNDNVSR